MTAPSPEAGAEPERAESAEGAERSARSPYAVPARAVAVLILLAAGALLLRPRDGTSTGDSASGLDLLATVGAGLLGALGAVLAVVAFRLSRQMRRVSSRAGPPPLRRRPSLLARVAVVSLCAALLMSPAGALFLKQHRPGALLGPPSPTATPSPDQRGERRSGAHHPPLGIAAALGAAIGLLALAGGLAARRRPHLEPDGDQPFPVDLVVAAGGAALDVAADSSAATDPRARVIGCYAAMERALSAGGAGRRPADTPTDMLLRAQRARLVRPGPADLLTDLFRRARFSTEPITTVDVHAARAALAALRDDSVYRSPA